MLERWYNLVPVSVKGYMVKWTLPFNSDGTTTYAKVVEKVKKKLNLDEQLLVLVGGR